MPRDREERPHSYSRAALYCPSAGLVVYVLCVTDSTDYLIRYSQEGSDFRILVEEEAEGQAFIQSWPKVPVWSEVSWQDKMGCDLMSGSGRNWFHFSPNSVPEQAAHIKPQT